ncbi:thermonuclease family protein [Chryseobacterium sp. CT-SW4]|uniref:thermonuclease family protein n=1 Tax=Chryseobacterium sp. SW-1 TaxID=3157343 RepID=UPI003B014CB0
MLYTVFIFPVILISAQTKAKVIAVKDGDTVVVLLGNNKQEVLRLAEVDCPEKGQPYGKNAKQFTSSQVFGKKVTFYRMNKDRYGRTVARVFYKDDKYLSAEIIKAGYGWWYYQLSKNILLKKYESLARENKSGLWADKNAVAPWDFRKNKRKGKTKKITKSPDVAL